MIRILMLGGGYVTIDAYRSVMRALGRAVRRGEVEITVVTPDPYHTFHGWTGEVLAGLLPLEHTLTPLKSVLPHARILLGRARRVDAQAQTVEVATEQGETVTLQYDHLLLGVGAQDPLARFPGLAEHGHCLKDTRSMQRLHAFLETWQPSGGRAVVVGGGFAGVEMAAALRERFSASTLQIELISGTPELLPVLRPQFRTLADHAGRTLAGRQITVRPSTRVQSIEAGGVRLQGGEWLPADLVLVTAGMAAQDIAGLGALPRHSTGGLLTDAFLRLPDHPNIWTGGDAAHVRHPVTGDACPTNALWAMKHGMCAGRNIARTIGGRPLQAFNYRGLGQGAGLAVGNGITELHGMQFTGRVGWLFRMLFFVWYMPSKAGGARVLGDWLRHGQRRRRVAAPAAADAAVY